MALTVVALGIYFALRLTSAPVIWRYAAKGRLKPEVVSRALKTVNILTGIIALATIFLVWGLDFKGLLALSASLLAVTGVAMFAAWSVLSNITAFFILPAHSSFNRGTFVRVIDGDNYIEGFISEINLFNTKLISESREVVIYPNNLLLTRPMIVNPRHKLGTAGKIIPPATDDDKPDVG